ncbi:MAG: PQQ-binding-like beta-propeller repeat protein [bacterium]|nr:PQQ-binding-like beta-propeller repeat protein [bacterium]
MKTLRKLILPGLCLLVLPVAFADSETSNWPSFRGPTSDGKSAETGLLTSWPDAGPEQLWQVPLGGGFSGIAAVDGKLFTLYGKGGRELAAAIDAGTGKQLWKVDLDQERHDRFGNGPRSTPLVEDGVVYAVSALGTLAALQAEGGEIVWKHDLREQLGARVPEWGVSASPIIEGDLLLFDVGGKPGHSIVAFDKRTGEKRWATETDIPGYSTPVTFTVGGVRQTVFFTGTNVVAVDPAKGTPLWKQPWKTAYDINAAAPIFIAPDRLFVSSGYDTGAAMFQITAEGGKASATADRGASVSVMWKSRGMKNQFSSSIYHAGHIYGFDNKNFKCIDATTGEDRWRKGSLGHGSLLYADGHLVVLSEGGQLLLVEAIPGSYREKASFELTEGKHWTVPTLYGGKLYVRNERDLYCLKVKS